MRGRTTARRGAPAETGAQASIVRYVAVRHDWLANHGIPVLRHTVYAWMPSGSC
jgi:hypothetical protein